MKKTIINKLSAVTVAGAIILQILPTVFSQEFKQGRIVEDDFNTFTEYTSSKDSQNNTILPDGWKISSDGQSSNSFTAYKDSSKTKTNAFSLGWLAKPVYSFSEVIQSGKLRVSFDVKTSNNSAETTSTPSLWIRSHTLDIDTTHNVEDYYYHLDQNGTEKDSQKYVVGEKMSTLLRVTKNNLYHYSLGSGHGTSTSAVTEEKISVSDGTQKGKGMVGDGDWHKVSALFDFDLKTASLSYDGISIYNDVTIPGTGGMKDIFLLSGSNGLVAVDNWYVNHYFDEAEGGAFVEDEYDTASKSLTLSFSENVTRDLTKDDFDIINTDGTKAEIKEITNYSNSTVKLEFGDLQDGVYTVACKEGFLSDGQKCKNTVSFSISENIHNAEDKKYFINESFESYTGGMPEGWYSLTDEIEEAKLTASSYNGGKALKISSNNPIAYEFDGALMNGIYNIEFDVKNTSGWYMHLLDSAMTDENWCKDNSTDWVYQEDYNRLYDEYKASCGASYTDAGWDSYIADTLQDSIRENALKQTKKNTVVMGRDGDEFKWNKGRKPNLADASELQATPTAEWTSVKITLDFNNGSYYYKIGGNEEQKVTFASLKTAIDGSVDQSGTLRYDRIALVNHETKLREFVHGVGGIAFTSVGNGTLEIDNVKVYGNDYYNFYEDFNTVQSNGIIRRTVQPGWYNILMEGYGKYGYTDVNSTSARNIGIGNIDATGGNTSDALDGTAAELISTDGPIVGLFEKPIKLGKKFTIELDWRNKGSNKLYLGIVNKANMYPRAENTKTTSRTATGEVPTCTDDVYKYSIILRACPFGFSYFAPHDYKSLSTREADITPKKMLDAVEVGVWHLKYNVKTSSTGFEYQLDVTSKDGTQSYSTDWVKQDKTFTYTMDDIVGITFGGRNSYIDNIKVYEARNVAVMAYNAVYPDEEAKLSDTVKNTAKGINIELSTELLNTDGISVKYSDGVDILYEKELLADKKTVKLIFKEALKSGKTLTVSIDDNTKPLDKEYSVNETSKEFSVIKENEGIHITKFRLYEKLGGNQLYFNYHAEDRPNDLRTIPEGYYPVIAESLTKKNLNNVKLEIEGYNYGDTTDLSAMLLGYDSVSSILHQRVTENITVEKGAFELSINLGALTNQEIKRIKAFLWDKSTYAPKTEELNYAY